MNRANDSWTQWVERKVSQVNLQRSSIVRNVWEHDGGIEMRVNRWRINSSCEDERSLREVNLRAKVGVLNNHKLTQTRHSQSSVITRCKGSRSLEIAKFKIRPWLFIYATN